MAACSSAVSSLAAIAAPPPAKTAKSVPTHFNGTMIIENSLVHLVLTRSPQDPASENKTLDEIRQLTSKWLDKLLTIYKYHVLKAGFLIVGRIVEPARFYRNLVAGAVRLRGSEFQIDILSPADADIWQSLEDPDLNVSLRSSEDEFATTDSDIDMSRPPWASPPKKPCKTVAQKQAKNAYKKKSKARKRAHSGSSSGSATTVQPVLILPIPDTSTRPDSHLPSSATSTHPVSHLPSCPTSIQSVTSPLPTSATTSQRASVPTTSATTIQPASLPPTSATTVQPRPKGVKKTKFVGVDFSKVNVPVPETPASLTLLVRPVDPAQKLREVNPLKLSLLLNSTFGGVVGIRDIRGGGLAVDLDPTTAKEEEALSTKRILGFTVNVTRPMGMETSNYGVVSGIHPDLTQTEISDHVQSDVPVTGVRRLAKPGTQSWTVKLSFAGTTIPTKISLFGRIHAVKAYVDRPLRCTKCHRFGHPARVCRSKARCIICTGEHEAESCPNISSPTCGNCGGPHKADDLACPTRAFQMKVIEVKATQGTTFKAARVAVSKAARSYASALKSTPAAPSSAAQTTATTSVCPAATKSVPSTAPASMPVLTPTQDTVSGTTTTASSKQPDLATLFQEVLKLLWEATASNDLSQVIVKVGALFASFSDSHQARAKGV